MYELLLEKVAENGFEQYEISNFARAGFESRHNSKYWLCEPVYAFGCSAHSFDGVKKRWSNERDTAKYVSLIERQNSAVVEENEIDLKSEFVFLGLRLAKGIDLKEYEKRFGANLPDEYAEDLKRLKEADLIKFENDHLRLTRKGFLFSNEVFEVFV
jgi:oxygen-independent coproporphyrinogen-3 oxidase